MWEVIPLLLCLGLGPNPDMSNCTLVGDLSGPYMTEEECRARSDVMTEAAPDIFARRGWTGSISVIREDRFCRPLGEEA